MVKCWWCKAKKSVEEKEKRAKNGRLKVKQKRENGENREEYMVL